jgi:hypothetical protein
MACSTILWNLFLLKKTPTTNVAFLLKRFATRMWIPSIVPQMLGIHVRFSKQATMSLKCWLEGILIYLLNNFFWLVNTSQTMSAYF